MRRLTCMTLAIYLAGPSVLQAADKVYIGGRPISGKVVKDTFEKVVLKIGPTETEFRQGDVTKIEYDPTPAEYLQGQLLRKQGDFETAAESYRAALSAPHHPQLEQYILYGLGVSLLNSGNVRDALKALEELVRKFPDTRFLVETAEALVQLKLKSGVKSIEEVEKYIKVVEQRDRLRAAVIRAKVFEQLKKASSALRWYKKVADGTDREDPIYWEAKLGMARVYILKGDSAAFQEEFREALASSKNVPREIMAEFYLCAARDAQKRAENDPDLLDKALSYYVRVFSLYNTRKTSALSAEAAFQAGLIAELVSTRGEHPELKSEAQRLFRLVVSKYPNTQWAKHARQRIK